MKHKLIIIILILPLMVNLLVFNSAEFIAGASTIRVTGVSLNVETLRFDSLGSTQMLIPDIRPMNATNQNIVFTIANENVAQVNESGTVTAVSNGTTLVTVTTEDGDFSASALVNVQSHFIEIFEVNLDADSYNNHYQLLNRDTHSLEVIVYPYTNMLDARPVVRFNHNGVLNVLPFGEPIVENNIATFKTTLTANRIGTAIATISILEGATNREIHRNIPINVSTNPEDGLKFMFDGATYGEGETVRTIRNKVALNVNTNAPGLEFSLTPFNLSSYELEELEEGNVTINNINDQYYLEFSKAYVVRLYFRALHDDLGESYVYIKSTFGSIDTEELRATLSGIPVIDMNTNTRSSISFEITPLDFERYFNVIWTSSANLTIQRIAATNILFTANAEEVNNTFIRLSIRNQEDDTEAFYHKFEVTVTHRGVCEIRFRLNDDNGNPIGYGFEQTHVFGNRTSNEDDFSFEITYTTTSVAGAVQGVTFKSNNNLLATVNDRGIVTFNRNFDFGNYDRAEVTITAIARHAGRTGEYATAFFVFIVINAADVSNFNEFDQANIKGLNMVLRGTVSFPRTWSQYSTSHRYNAIQGSLHGNGHTMNASGIIDSINSSNHIVFNFLNIENFISNNETLITNVVFSGFSDSMEYIEENDNNPYIAMQSRGTLVQLGANITFQYNKLERAGILLNIRIDSRIDEGVVIRRFLNHDIKVVNNLFSEAGFTGIYLAASHSDAPYGNAENMQFGNLIFERTLFGIVIEPTMHPAVAPFMPGASVCNRKLEFTLIQGSILHFHNWISEDVINEMVMQLDGFTITLRHHEFDRKKYDGQHYISLGLVKPEVAIDMVQVDPNAQFLPFRYALALRSRLEVTTHTMGILGSSAHIRYVDLPAPLPPLRIPFFDMSEVNVTLAGTYFNIRVAKSETRYNLENTGFEINNSLTIFTPGEDSPFFVAPHTNPNLDLIHRGVRV